MPASSPGAATGYLLAALTVAAAGWLAYRQWADRGRRPPEPSADDARHYARQDLRRWAGVALMAALGLGLAILVGLGPARDKHEARVLVRGWLGISGILLGLLILALFDWAATNAFARRHRKLHRASLEAALRRRGRDARGPETNGTPNE